MAHLGSNISRPRQAGVKKIVVTHAMADPIGMTVEQMTVAAKLGAKMECVWMTNLAGPKAHLPSMRHWRKVTVDDYAKAMRAVGPAHFVLGSDLGQFLNPIPTDGMRAFLMELREAGFTDVEIGLMARKTPGALLGMQKEVKSKRRK